MTYLLTTSFIIADVLYGMVRVNPKPQAILWSTAPVKALDFGQLLHYDFSSLALAYAHLGIYIML